MASLASSGAGTPGPTNKQIPLLCIVCPEAPHFSDVSHLLTHIASKGHLHHETQTRLKSHQDIAASVTLGQYEQWYKDNGIEALLVERMRAKQLKEAVRSRRSRGSTPAPALKSKRRSKRPSNSTPSRMDDEEFGLELPLFPPFVPSDNDTEIQDGMYASQDMLSLKGQVWPGMGKMDLANEDMKRTRNQRKPNSVIEKMRRTSEGIEPTQVVMTSEFEVERVKGVYDSSSPVPGQEDETPKKQTRPKRRRTEALAEVSSNVPRGGNRRLGRGALANGTKTPRLKSSDGENGIDAFPSSLGGFRHGHDVFCDVSGTTGMLSALGSRTDILTGPGPYDGRPFTPPGQDQKYDVRDPQSFQNIDSIPHSALMSPTPTSRSVSARLLSTQDPQRAVTQGPGHFGHSTYMTLSTFGHQEPAYGLDDGSIYGNSVKPFSTAAHFNNIHQDSFRIGPSGTLQPKHGDLQNCATIDSLPASGNGHFLSVPECNPLFSQDRMFPTAYGRSTPNPSLSSLGFTPINCDKDRGHGTHDDPNPNPPVNGIKLEPRPRDSLDSTQSGDTKHASFGESLWDTRPQLEGGEIRDGLGEEADV
ncbi:hypothetical protein JDV02_001168 [Purpureocillium takamizusanense]|uniref:Uncharacterized protein n=1 Tax=Purpureocillium takamizusanense TaxID=2060973 RepID=A0A9Q8Q7K7_9HYPO|nr:uncharacterized protein JDV02_001168 [Purpureocillium takamizusanense]UNI14550.1 hypothetical protein JDV02_001168 [Purpureocillium takamizusanense]